MRNRRVSELLLQALQDEQDRARVYEAALRLGRDEGVRTRWARSLASARAREETLVLLRESLALDARAASWRRDAARRAADALVDAIETAGERGSPEAAQLVACECVLLAETREQLTSELLTLVAGRVRGEDGKLLRRARRKYEASVGPPVAVARECARDLWLAALGLVQGAAATASTSHA
jgi:hypothetical protein